MLDALRDLATEALIFDSLPPVFIFQKQNIIFKWWGRAVPGALRDLARETPSLVYLAPAFIFLQDILQVGSDGEGPCLVH